MLPQARDAMIEGMARWANPSSPHAEGRAARAALEDARARIKAALGWEGELIFTSGASEALAIGLSRAKATRRIVSAVEHDAVFRAAPDADVLALNAGRPDRDSLAMMLTAPGRPVVAIQHTNSETGAILLDAHDEPLIEQVRQAGGLFLSDCVQSAGKYVLPDADMIVVSAHKLGGPPGIGALLVRDFSMLEASGGQEFGYRGGTENLPAILGFARAAELVGLNGEGHTHWLNRFWGIADSIIEMERAIEQAGATLITAGGSFAPHICAIAMPGMSAAAQLMRLDAMGFSVSAGSACASGSLKPSRALRGFGIADDVAMRTIRVSFGWSSSVPEIQAFQEAWLTLARDAAARAA
ncbi:MAG: aminotransferase [Alphaproteobacteria bacterium HGW-Alphaproteobacteria-16]|nr:MAG: aminotransferase [Alphaproteobacteria bacterium HGW-Alphaproteobacteria-16]